MPFQFGAQFAEIVDLAVVDDDVAPVGRMHRLGACRCQVDDGEPPVSEADARFRIAPGIGAVRASVGEGVGHGARGGGGIPVAHCISQFEDARNAAHQARASL